MGVHSMSNYEGLRTAFKEDKWVSADEQVTPIIDMDNIHLFYTIELLRRNLDHKNYNGQPKLRSIMVAWLFKLQAEANMRGQLGRID